MDQALHPVLTLPQLHAVARSVADELSRTAGGKQTPLPCYLHPIPTHRRDDYTGASFVVGGTMGKYARWRMHEGKVSIVKQFDEFRLPSRCSIDEFFSVLTQNVTDTEKFSFVGLDFAYPLVPQVRNRVLDGTVVRFTKENRIDGLQNRLAGGAFAQFLRKHKGIEVSVAAANDLICLLLGGVSAHPEGSRPQVAGVIGTGINIAFYDTATRWRSRYTGDCSVVALNTEMANFDRFPVSPAGAGVDAVSNNPGSAGLEKEVGGAYLYRVYNWLVRQHGVDAQTISDTLRLSDIAQQSDHPGCAVAFAVLDRSAQLAAAAFAGVLTYVGTTSGHIPIAMGGSLFWKGAGYRSRLKRWMTQLLPDTQVHFVEVPGSDLTGAAVLTSLEYGN